MRTRPDRLEFLHQDLVKGTLALGVTRRDERRGLDEMAGHNKETRRRDHMQ